MSRLPIRLRLTLAFAFAMALVLAGMGAFVSERVGSSLLASVDQSLRSQALEAASHARGAGGLRERDVEGGATSHRSSTPGGAGSDPIRPVSPACSLRRTRGAPPPGRRCGDRQR